MRIPSWLAGLRSSEAVGPFVIAEAGVNHNGDMDIARRLVDAAADAGAHAVKFQTFVADELARRDTRTAAYQRRNLDGEESQYRLLQRLELTPNAHREILDYCRGRGIVFLSTPFDGGSARLLADLGVPLIKISSTDVTNLPFLRDVGELGLPIVLSTGMSYLAEVEDAVRTLEGRGCDRLLLLHCTTSYPTAISEVNLRAMRTLEAFGYPVGYSDHTVGLHVPVAATALGAVAIEKHFTLDRTLPGPDHRASLQPDELRELVRQTREAFTALGSARKRPTESEKDGREVVRRSLSAAEDLDEGTVLGPAHLTARRPADGIDPRLVDVVYGRTLRRRLGRGETLRWDDLG